MRNTDCAEKELASNDLPGQKLFLYHCLNYSTWKFTENTGHLRKFYTSIANTRNNRRTFVKKLELGDKAEIFGNASATARSQEMQKMQIQLWRKNHKKN